MKLINNRSSYHRLVYKTLKQIFHFTLKEEISYYDIIIDSLKFHGLAAEEEINIKEFRRFNRWRADIYISDLLLVIEVHGEDHFEPQRIKNKPEEEVRKLFFSRQRIDAQKENICKEFNIKFLAIPYYEINKNKKNFKKYLEDKIDGVINNV